MWRAFLAALYFINATTTAEEYVAMCGADVSVNPGSIIHFSNREVRPALPAHHALKHNRAWRKVKGWEWRPHLSHKNTIESDDDASPPTNPFAPSAHQQKVLGTAPPPPPIAAPQPQPPNRTRNLPPLYSKYFKRQNKKTNIHPEASTVHRDHQRDLFHLFQKGSRSQLQRLRRSLEESTQNAGRKSCSWSFRRGPHCSTLVSHLTAGDTMDMDCQQEKLKVGSEFYCSSDKHFQRTLSHKGVKVVDIEYIGGGETTLEGYVMCA